MVLFRIQKTEILLFIGLRWGDNMRYYALYNENGKLVAIGTGLGGAEITEAEYNELLTAIHTKALLVNQLYHGQIGIESVPIEWQEEIRSRVDERIAAEAEHTGG